MAIQRHVWLSPSRLVPAPRAVQYASWVRWSCGGCKRVLFEHDDLAQILDGVTGHVSAIQRRWVALGRQTGPCPRCPSTMWEIELLGQRAARCPQHGLWLEPGSLVAMRGVVHGVS